mgnify:FL=1
MHERNYYASKNTIQWFSWKFNDIHLSFICAPSARALLFGHFCNGEMLGFRIVVCAFLQQHYSRIYYSWMSCVHRHKMQFWGPLFIKRYFSLYTPHSTYINCTTRCDSLTHKFKGFTHSLNFKVNYENFYSTLMFSADTFTLLCTFLWYLLYFSFFFFFFEAKIL